MAVNTCLMDVCFSLTENLPFILCCPPRTTGSLNFQDLQQSGRYCGIFMVLSLPPRLKPLMPLPQAHCILFQNFFISLSDRCMIPFLHPLNILENSYLHRLHSNKEKIFIIHNEKKLIVHFKPHCCIMK